MANRKGVEAVSKWKTSDGAEFTSAREANDHQGAVNELAGHYEAFEAKHLAKNLANRLPVGTMSPENIRKVIFEWERFKNANDTNPGLLPVDGIQSNDAPEEKSSITMDEIAGVNHPDDIKQSKSKPK